jgi:hypothetical protein
MQRRLSAGLAAVGSLAAVGVGMAVMDDRMRLQMTRIICGEGASPEVVSYAHHVNDVVLAALNVVRDQSMEHAPLTIFALAATVLLLFMLRT